MRLAVSNLFNTQNVAHWLKNVPGPLGLDVHGWGGVDMKDPNNTYHGSNFRQNEHHAMEQALDTLVLHACIALKVSMGG